MAAVGSTRAWLRTRMRSTPATRRASWLVVSAGGSKPELRSV